jgi:phosphatidylethanolamine-binding protein (PEBP) family uncharacterized protein
MATTGFAGGRNTIGVGRGLAAIGTMIAVALLAGGCGESSKPTANVSSTSTSATGTQAATGTAASGTTSSGAATKPSTARASSATQAHNRGGSTTSGAKRVHRPAGAALAGLGSAKPAHRLSPARRAKTALADITLGSPAVATSGPSGNSMPAQYTCHGKNISLPLSWHGVPAGTQELVLFVISSTPVNGKLFYDWALAGINPTLGTIGAGETPAGAVVGRNGNGQDRYSVCPPGGTHETYVFALYALPRNISAKPGFEPNALRQEVLQLARHTGILLLTYQGD